MGTFARLRAQHSELIQRRLVDGVYGVGILLAVLFLFFIDSTHPRGVVDGVGYAAVVALSSRFGKRVLLGCAIVTTGLTLLGSVLVPPTGVSLIGMWANRAFALVAIWVVALVMKSRMDLEARILTRDRDLRRHEEALAFTIRTGLMSEVGYLQRLLVVCQNGGQALRGSTAFVGLRNEDDTTVTILQSWHQTAPGPRAVGPGSVLKTDRHLKSRLMEEFVVGIDDIETSELELHSIQAARVNGIRSLLAAEIFQGARRGTIIFGSVEPRLWTDEEMSFARALANLAGLLISMEKNADTLAALELTDDGIYTEDAAGKVQYANRAARLQVRIGADGREFPKPTQALMGERDRHEIRFEDRDLEIHRSRLPGGGMIVHLADVTERKQAAAERMRLETRLSQAAKMEAIGQLASGTAHDFNNILGAISGFASFIAQDTPAGSENRDFAQRILNASRRGKEMVEQIMAFAETRAVSHGITNIGRTLRRCEELLVSGMQPGAQLEVEMPDLPLLARGNDVQVGQLLANLVVNGRDALGGVGGVVEMGAAVATKAEIERLKMRSGGSQANGPQERIIGEIRPDTGYARLWVRDNGGGIAPGNLDRIFEPFFTTKGRQRGTGLGLAVVHGVVRSHNGFCRVHSEIGKGTEFQVFLPLVKELAGDAGSPAGKSGEPCRVLIVDDEADMADMLSIALERLGHHTVAVQSPLIALAALEEDPAAFDALLTDQLMPGLKGTELIREARRIAPGLRAVLCTGNAEMSEAEALALGADAVVYKPVDIQAVDRAIGGVPRA